MKKLKILLKSKWFLLCLLCLFVVRFYTVVTSPKTSSFHLDDKTFIGRIEEWKEAEEGVKVTIKTKQEILSGIWKYPKEERMASFAQNDFVMIQGNLKELVRNTTPYLFNYKKYAKRHQQFYSLEIKDIKLLKKNKNFLYSFKTILKRRIDKFESAPYLHAFLLGDTSYIAPEVMESYRDNGVSHLLAISGMHVSFLMGILSFFLEKRNLSAKLQLLIFISFLSVYIFLVGFSPSILRASLFFLLLRINSLCSLEIKPIFLLTFLCFLLLAINPYYLWEVGFQYSFAISFLLVLSSTFLEEGTYFKKLLTTSYISFLPSVIIGIYNFHQIQLLSIFYNLIFVPFVSFIIFPFSFIVLMIPCIETIYLFFTKVLESLSLFLTNFQTFTWIMKHPSLLEMIYLISGVFLTYILLRRKKRIHIFFLLFFLYLYHNASYLIPEDYVISLDVGQGDATFLSSHGEATLIDTGGSIYKSYAQNTIIPYLKAKGVLKIDTLVLTHGDFDHMGEAMNLVNNFKVEKVIFNCGPHNDLENELIKVLEKKKIEHYSCIKELEIGNNKLHFLNTREHDNENDNSNVIYTELNNYRFLFMGDASTLTEKEILDKYNLPNIDVLKIGHHGSKTSTSKELINTINPKYSMISVGKNNRYGHPNKKVLNNLKDSKIYRTDINGGITFKIKKDKLDIGTCPP